MLSPAGAPSTESAAKVGGSADPRGEGQGGSATEEEVAGRTKVTLKGPMRLSWRILAVGMTRLSACAMQATSLPPQVEGGGGEFSTASKEEESAGKLLEMLKVTLKTHERRYQSKVYPKCFSGWQLVDWLVDKIDAESLTCVTKVRGNPLPKPGARAATGSCYGV